MIQVIAGATLCVFDKMKGCSLNPPPKSATFVLLMAFIIIIFILPMDYCIGYIQEEFASKRPRLEELSLSTNSWLGSMHHSRGVTDSAIKEAISRAASARSIEGASASEEQDSYTSKGGEAVTQEGGVGTMTDEDAEFGEWDRNFLAKKQYHNLGSPLEELTALLAKIDESIRENANVSSATVASLCASSRGRLAAMKAIRMQLMVNADGTQNSITFRQKLQHGNLQNMLIKKLTKVRLDADMMCDEIEELEVADECVKDIALLRNFILEHVSFYSRFSLRRCFQEIDGCGPGRVNVFVWIASWTVIISCLLFCLYWTFAWGVANGGDTLRDWGMDYGVGMISDILLCEVVKILIMFVYAIINVKPQLQVIKRVINDCGLSLIQDKAVYKEEVNVVQHFSPACRAATTSRLSTLPAAAVLRKITDEDVERCREHRNHSSGSGVLYLVLLAATICALSEGLINQTMDISIHSVWLSFLLINTKTLAVSPVLLAALYAVIGGALLYHQLVFIPTVARLRRQRSLQSMSSADFFSSKLSRSNLSRWNRLGVHKYFGKLSGGMGMMHMSVSSERTELKKERVRFVTIIWTGMNKASYLHGHGAETQPAPRNNLTHSASPTRDRSYGLEESKSHNPDSFDINDSSCLDLTPAAPSIPQCVLDMRVRSMAMSLEEDDKQHLAPSARFFRAVPAFHGVDVSVPTVTRWTRIKRVHTACLIQASSVITYDAHIALNRMLLRHDSQLRALNAGLEVCEFEVSAFDPLNPTQDFMSISEAATLLQWVWDAFHPYRRELSLEEKEDTVEEFLSWRARCVSISIGSVEHTDSAIGIDSISHADFSKWFIALVARIASSRAYDYDTRKILEDVEESAAADQYHELSDPSTSRHFH